ncbi:hypothetical protein C8R47DRAFT_1189565 [Mycena vitilis]|nr:hypothetical protein C8R47DRAFT_1189565 [Mycena vitilis]
MRSVLSARITALDMSTHNGETGYRAARTALTSALARLYIVSRSRLPSTQGRFSATKCMLGLRGSVALRLGTAVQTLSGNVYSTVYTPRTARRTCPHHATHRFPAPYSSEPVKMRSVACPSDMLPPVAQGPQLWKHSRIHWQLERLLETDSGVSPTVITARGNVEDLALMRCMRTAIWRGLGEDSELFGHGSGHGDMDQSLDMDCASMQVVQRRWENEARHQTRRIGRLSEQRIDLDDRLQHASIGGPHRLCNSDKSPEEIMTTQQSTVGDTPSVANLLEHATFPRLRFLRVTLVPGVDDLKKIQSLCSRSGSTVEGISLALANVSSLGVLLAHIPSVTVLELAVADKSQSAHSLGAIASILAPEVLPRLENLQIKNPPEYEAGCEALVETLATDVRRTVLRNLSIILPGRRVLDAVPFSELIRKGMVVSLQGNNHYITLTPPDDTEITAAQLNIASVKLASRGDLGRIVECTYLEGYFAVGRACPFIGSLQIARLCLKI